MWQTMLGWCKAGTESGVGIFRGVINALNTDFAYVTELPWKPAN